MDCMPIRFFPNRTGNREVARFGCETDVIRLTPTDRALHFKGEGQVAPTEGTSMNGEAVVRPTGQLEGRAAVFTATFERGDEDAEMAKSQGRTGEAQLAAELQEACDAGILNGVFQVNSQKGDAAVEQAIQMSQEGDQNVIAFVRAVIDSDAHDKLDAIDVAGIVLAMMRGDFYAVGAEDPLAIWARYTLPEELFASIFTVQS